MNFHINVNINFPQGDKILEQLSLIIKNQQTIMQELEDLKAAVAEEDTVIDSVLTLVSGMADQIAALKPNAADIAALAADIRSKKDALAAAVTANTPPPPAV